MESNRKRSKVVMIPTNGRDIAMLSKRTKDGMLQSATGRQGVANNNTMWQPQHLYLTTDEDPKEGDWVYSDEREYGIFKWDEKCPLVVRKIISSTDPKLYTPLGPDDVNIFDIPFPHPSQSFIEKYCKLGGIDEVDVEYVYHKVWDKQTEELLEKYITLKVDSNNEITIHAIEEMW